jgi:hypothetical protein
MADGKEPFGYLAFRSGGEKRPSSFLVTFDANRVSTWRSESDSIDTGREEDTLRDPDHVSPNEKSAPGNIDAKRPKDLFERFLNAMNSAIATIGLTSFSGDMVIGMFVEGALLPHAQKKLKSAEADNDVTVYHFTESQFLEMRKLMDQYNDMREGRDTLPGATLLSMVATFDAYFAEIIRYFIGLHPEKYGNKQVSLKDIFKKKNLEEIVDQVLDDEIVDIMRGSHTNQVAFVEEYLNIKIIEHYERWPNFVEIFERRNLVAHGNLIVNQIYIDRCLEAKYRLNGNVKTGSILTLTARYLSRSVSVLMEFGMLLIFTLWRKHIPDSDEDAFSCLNDCCYQLISKKRYVTVNNVLSFCIFKQKKGARVPCSENVYRMMIINLANAYKKLKEVGECERVLADFDWTATKDEFQICIAALRGDVESVIRLMPIVARGDVITANAFRDWPVLDWIRDDPKIQATFKAVYGEPLWSELSSASEATPDVDADTGNDTAATATAAVNITRH